MCRAVHDDTHSALCYARDFTAHSALCCPGDIDSQFAVSLQGYTFHCQSYCGMLRMPRVSASFDYRETYDRTASKARFSGQLICFGTTPGLYFPKDIAFYVIHLLLVAHIYIFLHVNWRANFAT